MRELTPNHRPWLPAESDQFIAWIEEHRSVGEMSFLLHRDTAELEARAAELGVALPREFETRFFFRKSSADPIKPSQSPPG